VRNSDGRRDTSNACVLLMTISLLFFAAPRAPAYAASL
jgi:hypothetical protein